MGDLVLFPSPSGMDPTWEIDYVFNIADENTAKCSASFFMGDTPDKMQQIGDTQTYLVRE